MKIITMQSGGAIPFVSYTPVLQNTTTRQEATTASSSSKSDSDWLDKATINAINENGLTSDVEIFYNYAQSVLGNSSFELSDPGTSVSQLIQLRRFANRIKNNKQLYDKALSHIETTNTGDDYAMTTDGKVYVAETDDAGNSKISTVKIETFKDNLDKYSLLTNEQLLDIRNNSEQYAFNETILRDIGGSVGMEEIVSDITNVISKFKTRETSKYQNLSDSVAKGMEFLYKINIEASTAYQDVVENGEVKKDISAAIKYIYASLNNNAKNVLKLHAELNDTTVTDFLKDSLVLNTSYSYKEDLEKAPKGRSGSENSGGDKLTDKSFINTVVLGDGVEDSTIIISGHHNAGIKTTGQVYGFRDEKGNRIAMNNLEQILSQEDNALGNTIDLNSISIGNTLVSNLDLHKLVYDGSSTLNRMVLPIDEDVYAATGRIKPDIDALEKFQKFKTWSKNNPNASPQEQALKLEELGLNVKYDPNTNGWKFNNTQVFLSINGYVSDEVINIEDSDKQFLSHMSRAERKQLLDTYENYVNYGQAAKDSDKAHPDSINLVSFLDWVGESNLYQGMIFMPVLSRGMEYLASSNELVPKSTFVDMKNQRSIQDQQRNFRNNF